MNPGGSPIKVDSEDLKSIDAYEEYRRIVGEDDDGKPFTPKQYEAYKNKYLPMRRQNRIFVSWMNPNGVDCILAGPQSECFCQHRLIQHKTDFEIIPTQCPIQLPCKHCRCLSFHVMPKFGSQVARCHCKHYATDHNVATPYFCSKSNCNCNGFRTSMRCDCGIEFHKHEMIMETAEERHSRGKPIGQTSPYQAMGGLTGFSSLAPGIIRMDTSGAGKLLSEEEMNKSITSVDNPFLRSHTQGVFNYKLAVNDMKGAERERHEVESQMRRPGESELDYYERRYQEREKAKYIRKPEQIHKF
uniref:Protein FAM221A n=1 Tax=Schistosoma mansoni TaxID=6183 RepID=A0A3Q0KME0_SCHMA